MKNKFKPNYFLAVITTALLLATAGAHAGETTRVSVSSAGVQGTNWSEPGAISADGRFVAFWSQANNLVAGDTNGSSDAFVHDRQTGQTTRVSVSSAGVQGNNNSFPAAISADGRYVVFKSFATNLVAADTNDEEDAFVHDRQTGQTKRVSVSSAGVQGNNSSNPTAISGDGRFVAFRSYANNLVAGDTNGRFDAFVHDRQTGQTTRVSVSSAGVQGDRSSDSAAISADGRYVAFSSEANNLVAGDANGTIDAFVHDRQTGQTTRVSVDSARVQDSSHRYPVEISADGRYVAFKAFATNLTNSWTDAFVHDRQTRQTTRISVDSTGKEGNGASQPAAISADGRFVAFVSSANNLVAGDANGAADAFVHDRQTGQTMRVSVSSAGVQGNSHSYPVEISADGRFVAFSSYATNLVAGDTNSRWDAFVHGRLLTIAPKNVVLLLHGMNTIPTTWNPVVSQYFSTVCSVIDNGLIEAVAKPNAQNTYCYRVKFGAFDATSTNKGLENAWLYGQRNGYASAGDYSTFNQLGSEVDKAISAIKKKLPGAKILLIGHSRGGLAARAFLQQPLSSVNKNSVAGLITTGSPHNGTRLGRIYGYIKNTLLKPDGVTRNTDKHSVNDWKVIDFLRKAINCNVFIASQFLDARRPVIGYLDGSSPMIISLNKNKANLPVIQYGELVYDGVYLGKLHPQYNLFDEPGYGDICDQVSRRAEAWIKGGTVAAPSPSTNYPGDGIVTGASQGAAVFPTAKKLTYKLGVLHTNEPKQTAHIADMTCKLGFPWLKSCAATALAPATKQAQATFKTVEAVSHDYDALVALQTEQLWQDWLAFITDDAKANQREQLAVALGIKLRGGDNAALYADSEQRLLNANTPRLERARLAGLLAEIATPLALEVLTDALLNPDCSAIQTALSNAIQNLADSFPEQPRLADLSAVLETAWTMPKQNQLQLNTLALALAKLGTPQGVELLLTAVDNTGAFAPSAKKKRLSYEEQQARAAFMAMDEIINPDSEPVLSSAFMSHRATEAVFIAAGNGLVNLGREDAAQRVLQLLNELPDNAVAVGQQWLTSLSGKIDKAALRTMTKAVGMPRQRLLREQLEEIVQ